MQGQVDVQLNEVGKQQASLVADRLAKDFKIAAVYSSDLKRALVTAETIASRCGGLEGGGESLDQLIARFTSSLERIAEKHRGERVVVVTHGAVIEQLCLRACPNVDPKGKVSNTSVNILCISDEDKWTLKCWSDVCHLNQTGFLKSDFGGDATSA